MSNEEFQVQFQSFPSDCFKYFFEAGTAHLHTSCSDDCAKGYPGWCRGYTWPASHDRHFLSRASADEDHVSEHVSAEDYIMFMTWFANFDEGLGMGMRNVSFTQCRGF